MQKRDKKKKKKKKNPSMVMRQSQRLKSLHVASSKATPQTPHAGSILAQILAITSSVT